VLQLFRRTMALSQNIKTGAMVPNTTFGTTGALNLAQYDPSQTKFLDEALILVDRDDKVMGKISKVDGHMNSYNETGYAHRAFSVFLFNEQNKLLVHQRSEKKITFPMLWTNSCCSHPLYTEDEMIEENYNGPKNAIRRRVKYELGHDLKEINDLHFMGKIYYKAKCDETWGEHEIDYCFFIKRDFKESEFEFNKDELQEIKWVGKDEIMDFLATRYTEKKEQVTPWFGAIMHYQLFNWWDKLIQGEVGKYEPSHTIADLNEYQKPIFVETNGSLTPNIDQLAGKL